MCYVKCWNDKLLANSLFAVLPKIMDQPVNIMDISLQEAAKFTITATGFGLVFVWKKCKLNSTNFTDISKSGRMVHHEVVDGRSSTKHYYSRVYTSHYNTVILYIQYLTLSI